MYFPIDGVISIVSLTEEGDIAEPYTGGRDGAFSRAIHLYLHWLIGFTGQSAACKLHGLTERCARWLLITNDRADRARLEEASCPCYRIVANEFKRVLGGP